jgi:hypothetical protein
MAALAVASTAASVFTEVQTANAQNKAISAQLQQGQQQVADQVQAQENTRARQARVEQGRMMVAAGEAGLQLDSGSVENMMLDSQMQQLQANDAIKTNGEHQDQNLTSEANRFYSQVQTPSVIGAGLRLVSSGITGYNQGATAALQRQQISRAAGGSSGG